MRNGNVGQAAHTAGFQALRKKGLRDDITLLVVDFLPSKVDDRPPAFHRADNRIHMTLTPSLSTETGNETVEGINVLKPLETASGSWRERLAARRLAAVRRQIELRLLAQQAAEVAAHAEAEAVAKREAEAQAQMAAMSDTYRELAQLHVDPQELMHSIQQEQDAEEESPTPQEADGEGWVTVGGGGNSGGYASTEQQMRSAARQRPRQQRHQAGQQHQQQPPPVVAAAENAERAPAEGHVGHPAGRGGGRGYSSRGRGGRFSARGVKPPPGVADQSEGGADDRGGATAARRGGYRGGGRQGGYDRSAGHQRFGNRGTDATSTPAVADAEPSEQQSSNQDQVQQHTQRSDTGYSRQGGYQPRGGHGYRSRGRTEYRQRSAAPRADPQQGAPNDDHVVDDVQTADQQAFVTKPANGIDAEAGAGDEAATGEYAARGGRGRSGRGPAGQQQQQPYHQQYGRGGGRRGGRHNYGGDRFGGGGQHSNAVQEHGHAADAAAGNAAGPVEPQSNGVYDVGGFGDQFATQGPARHSNPKQRVPHSKALASEAALPDASNDALSASDGLKQQPQRDRGNQRRQQRRPPQAVAMAAGAGDAHMSEVA